MLKIKTFTYDYGTEDFDNWQRNNKVKIKEIKLQTKTWNELVVVYEDLSNTNT